MARWQRIVLAAGIWPAARGGSRGDLEFMRTWRGPGPCSGRGPVQRNNEATTDMANTPKKMKDPTEAALSAIQDALQVRDVDNEPESIAAPPKPGFPHEEP